MNTSAVEQVNTTGTQYTFTGDKCLDTTYQFDITAWNVVGEGEMGTFAEQHHLKGR